MCFFSEGSLSVPPRCQCHLLAVCGRVARVLDVARTFNTPRSRPCAPGPRRPELGRRFPRAPKSQSGGQSGSRRDRSRQVRTRHLSATSPFRQSPPALLLPGPWAWIHRSALRGVMSLVASCSVRRRACRLTPPTPAREERDSHELQRLATQVLQGERARCGVSYACVAKRGGVAGRGRLFAASAASEAQTRTE